MRVLAIVLGLLIAAPATARADKSVPIVIEELALSESSQPLFPTIVIRNSILRGNGIGVYVGYGGSVGGVALLNNLFTENAEAVRLLGAQSFIQGNEFRENLIGIKLQSVLIQGQKTVTMEVLPSWIARNNFAGNREYGILNLTDVPLEISDNFWGGPQGPSIVAAEARDAPERVLFWGILQHLLENSTLLRLAQTQSLGLSLTIAHVSGAITFIETLLIWGEPHKVSGLAEKLERIKGPVILQTWLEKPVQQEPKK